MKARSFQTSEVANCCTSRVLRLTGWRQFAVRNAEKAFASALAATPHGRVYVKFRYGTHKTVNRFYTAGSKPPVGLSCWFANQVIERSCGFKSVNTSSPHFEVWKAVK